jgi:hypothetical protein
VTWLAKLTAVISQLMSGAARQASNLRNIHGTNTCT